MLDRERNKAIEKAGKEISGAILKAARLIADAIREGREAEKVKARNEEPGRE